ncbi:hypothetical protein KC19_5G145600 [Ceratodon purpureus]|uniref:Uncharacterized protein n=1 Tax=Ceratodon purpureus TaxID=3225 RepID=A0A8T0I3C4_CERPU|nr:hypothetical protein KC19_5G145600 [Ceratodon purpureus]
MKMRSLPVFQRSRLPVVQLTVSTDIKSNESKDEHLQSSLKAPQLLIRLGTTFLFREMMLHHYVRCCVSRIRTMWRLPEWSIAVPLSENRQCLFSTNEMFVTLHWRKPSLLIHGCSPDYYYCSNTENMQTGGALACSSLLTSELIVELRLNR